MDTIKEAADSLLGKGEITQDEYNLLKNKGAFELPKEAAFGDALKKILWPIAAVGGVTIGAKEAIVDPLVQHSKIKKSFGQLKAKVPQLQEKDEEDIKDYFNVVKTFSPRAASNPLVAGALVNKMMEFGGVDHKLVQDISAIQAGMARPKIVDTAIQAAAKTLSAAPEND